MLGVGGSVVVRAEREMELLVAEVVGLGAVAEPGEFHFEIGLGVAYIDDDEGAVVGDLAAALREAQGLLVEFQGAV